MNRATFLVLYDPPPPYGGVRVSAAQTLRLLRSMNGAHFDHALFDTHPHPVGRALLEYGRRLRRVDGVVFQIGDLLTLLRKRALLYLLATLLMRKPIIFRGFAGGLARQYQQLPGRSRALLGWAARRLDAVTFQTKADYDFFSAEWADARHRFRWLPNTRSAMSLPPIDRPVARRFCFIGKVYRPKGVHHLVAAAPLLPAGVTVDLYGPLEPEDAADLGLDRLLPDSPVRYRGALELHCVTDVLREYDALVLPTTWRTEGHPGVILEAFASGVPVIATRWNGIPELVDGSCGLLIEPDSTAAVVDAIRRLHGDPAAWRRLCAGAHERLKLFDPGAWTRRFEHWIHEAAGRARAQEIEVGEPAMTPVSRSGGG